MSEELEAAFGGALLDIGRRTAQLQVGERLVAEAAFRGALLDVGRRAAQLQVSEGLVAGWRGRGNSLRLAGIVNSCQDVGALLPPCAS